MLFFQEKFYDVSALVSGEILFSTLPADRHNMRRKKYKLHLLRFQIKT
jgi:hypothetical protein